MKAIAICGSPRKNGNTETMLKIVLERLEKTGIETELIRLSGKNIRTCIACGGCKKTKDRTCSIKGDDFHSILGKMIDADVILLGTPVYFGSATSELTAVLHRAGYVARANGGLFDEKIGAPVVVARRAGQNFTFAQLMFWYTINNMIVPGSGYWNIGFGREPGDVVADSEGIDNLNHLATNLINLAEKLYSC